MLARYPRIAYARARPRARTTAGGTAMGHSAFSSGLSETSSRDTHSSSQPRIHILGTGNIGTIVAHSLASLPEPVRPRITLLLHRKDLLDAWKKRGETIDLLRYEDGASQPQGGIDVELVEPQLLKQRDPGLFQEPIRHLVVSVLASQTVGALAPIKHRLSAASTILFLQNGMGSPEEVAEKLYPDSDTLPNFLQGIVRVGGWALEPFVVRHSFKATLPVATIPRRGRLGALGLPGSTETDPGAESSRYLINALAEAPNVAAEEIDYAELFQQQLEKLAINVVANPLTAILDESNAVLQQPPLAPVIRALIAETASIIQALPELRDVPGVQERFAAHRLEGYVMGFLAMIQNTTTSMCQHLRAGKRTEIEYINGYLVNRAKDLGVPCELIAMLRQLILTKEAVGS